MPKFKPGDRVRLTLYALQDRMQMKVNRRTGVVIRADAWCAVQVLRDGTRKPHWYGNVYWEIDPAAIIGSAAWLDQRAYIAAFRRD